MSTHCTFSYSVPRANSGEIIDDVFEVGETNTQYLNWIMQLLPEDYIRVNAFAPFLSQVYDALDRNSYWAEFGTDAFEPEQAHDWAMLWLKLWQSDTTDAEIEAVKQNWRGDTERVVRELTAVIKQSECAKRHGVQLMFFIG